MSEKSKKKLSGWFRLLLKWVLQELLKILPEIKENGKEKVNKGIEIAIDKSEDKLAELLETLAK